MVIQDPKEFWGWLCKYQTNQSTTCRVSEKEQRVIEISIFSHCRISKIIISEIGNEKIVFKFFRGMHLDPL